MSFRDVVNQQQAKSFLKSSIAAGRVANGYLFHGPRGVGKSTMALAFAKSLNCEREDPDGCGSCTSCKKVARFVHPDVTLIFPTSGKKEDEEIAAVLTERSGDRFYVHAFPHSASIKIGTIQALRMDLASGVREGRWRIVILAYAEKMTPEASNCLLRMLEEPPARVTFVLTAPSRRVLLPTIVSRCQAVRFVALAAKEIEKILVEERDASPEEARVVAGLSGGSLSTALDLKEQDVVEYRKENLDRLKRINAGKPAEILNVAEGLAAARDREQVRRFVRLALLWFRDVLLVKYGAGADDVANRDMMNELTQQAGVVELAELRRRVNVLEDIISSMERHVDLSLLLSSSFLKLSGVVEDVGQPLDTVR
ncbi:MAG: DNA polymerase III subunit delta' [Candidatus Eiseniibacteriota bacterium]|nr:MAG: DNA polymerase III subunit delta' [Candidatus Eisenbacteria bacterium]